MSGVTLLATAGTAPLSGTLVVAAVVLASIGVFYAMTRSLRTVRRRVEGGTFGRPRMDADPDAKSRPETRDATDEPDPPI